MNTRPPFMLEESTVNSMEMAWIDILYSSHLKQQAACSAVGDSYSGWTEAKIPLTMFEKGGDDCVENILPARGLRVPTSLISSWWPKVAKTKIEPVVTSINLSELGASNCVSLKTIESCHDTRIALHLKHFFDGNLTSAVRARGESGMGPDHTWLDVGSLQEVQEALSNWQVISFLLFPLNFTPILVWRTLVRYRWCSMVPILSDRIKIINR